MQYFEHDPNTFKPLESNHIILDFSNCHYLGEIHAELKKKFGLPDYYGENWDALWDCQDGLFYERGFFSVEIHGFSSLEESLSSYCMTMLEIFDDVHKETPNVTFTVVS